MPFALFLLCSRNRQSSASAVFVFNASLSDVASASPKLFPVDLIKWKRVYFR